MILLITMHSNTSYSQLYLLKFYEIITTTIVISITKITFLCFIVYIYLFTQYKHNCLSRKVYSNHLQNITSIYKLYIETLAAFNAEVKIRCPDTELTYDSEEAFQKASNDQKSVRPYVKV